MSLSKIELYLYKEVISKAKYDNLTGKITIHLNDYIFLNLTIVKMNILKNLCKKHDIYLEQLPPKMKVGETQELIKEYNRLKRIIKLNPNKNDTEELTNMMYQIKERIALGHMQLVFEIINKNIKDISKSQEQEDIYQIGYETLLEFIDKYDDNQNTTFIYFLNRYLMYHINTKIMSEQKCLGNSQAYELKRLDNAIKKLNIIVIDNQALQDLSIATEWSIKRIKGLLSIKTLLEKVEIDSYDESNLPKELLYLTFEEDMQDQMMQNNQHIEKLLSILTPIQRQVIRLYYGFEDGNTHTYEEITTILNKYSKERIRQIIKESLTILTSSINGKYLESAYGKTPYFDFLNQNPACENEQLQKESIILSIPKFITEELVKNFGSPYTEILNLYYGLNGNINYDCQTISQILKLSVIQVNKIKTHGTDLILETMTKRLSPNFTGNYLEYMNNYYLNSCSKRK